MTHEDLPLTDRLNMIIWLVLVVVGCLAPALAAAPPPPRHPVVAELAAILEKDPQLATSVNYTLQHVPHKSWGSHFERTIPGLLDFFDAWVVADVYPSNDTLALATWTPGNGAGLTPISNPPFSRRAKRDSLGVREPISQAHGRQASASRPPDLFPANGASNSRGEGTGKTSSDPLTFISPIWSLASDTRNSVWLRSPTLLPWLQRFVQARGAFMDTADSWSPEIASAWWRSVNRSEYEVPSGGFTTFNSFFTRQVKPEARPVSRNSYEIASPADGYIWIESTNVSATSDFNLKADTLAPEELLGFNTAFVDNYIQEGMAVINFLAATDYHHFWAPVDGTVVAAGQLGGLYVANGDPCCVGDHRRAYVLLSTQSFGTIAMIFIGMYDISSIVLNSTTTQVGAAVHKGDELGHFQYGGSEIITLFQSNLVEADPDVYRGGTGGSLATRKAGQRYGIQRFA